MKWRTILFVSADGAEGINQPFAPIVTPALRKTEEFCHSQKFGADLLPPNFAFQCKAIAA